MVIDNKNGIDPGSNPNLSTGAFSSKLLKSGDTLTVIFNENTIEYYINGNSSTSVSTSSLDDVLSFVVNPLKGNVTSYMKYEDGTRLESEGTAAMRAGNQYLTILSFIFDDNNPTASRTSFEIFSSSNGNMQYRYTTSSNHASNKIKEYILTVADDGLCQITRL